MIIHQHTCLLQRSRQHHYKSALIPFIFVTSTLHTSTWFEASRDKMATAPTIGTQLNSIVPRYTRIRRWLRRINRRGNNGWSWCRWRLNTQCLIRARKMNSRFEYSIQLECVLSQRYKSSIIVIVSVGNMSRHGSVKSSKSGNSRQSPYELTHRQLDTNGEIGRQEARKSCTPLGDILLNMTRLTGQGIQ